jgi:hypothetical protein
LSFSGFECACAMVLPFGLVVLDFVTKKNEETQPAFEQNGSFATSIIPLSEWYNY